MDGFFGIGIQELVLIAIVALIVLGPERLPATFREIAKFIRQVRNMTNEFTTQFGDDFKALEDLDPRRILQRELASIDEEEQAKENTTKGKSTPAKPTTTTPKPTPAKATTAKTTTTATSSTSTTTAKSTTTTAKPATATTPSSTTAAPSTSTEVAAPAQVEGSAVTPPSTTDSTAAGTVTTEPQETSLAETENRIAPPALTAAKPEASAGSAEPSTPVVPVAAPTNGVPPKAAEPITTGDVVTSE